MDHEGRLNVLQKYYEELKILCKCSVKSFFRERKRKCKKYIPEAPAAFVVYPIWKHQSRLKLPRYCSVVVTSASHFSRSLMTFNLIKIFSKK